MKYPTPTKHVGDHLALDFLNTIAAPKGTPIEQLGNGQDLLDWLTTAGALDPAERERISKTLRPEELDRVAAQAVDFREWFRGVLEKLKAGGSAVPTSQDVERLNRVLAHDASFQQVELTKELGRARVVACRSWRDPAELLAPIAVAIADLVCGADFDLVRQCENPPCTLWFYDRTKGHRRRWCSQAVCGNRAKVAAFRERKQMAR